MTMELKFDQLIAGLMINGCWYISYNLIAINFAAVSSFLFQFIIDVESIYLSGISKNVYKVNQT